VAADIAARNVDSQPVAIDSENDEGPSTPSIPTTVSVTAGPFAPPFWIDRAPSEVGRKLAFVREARAGADIIYQGFVGDWERLKPDLLATIAEDFPQADLEPVPNDVELSDEAGERKLEHLPALLRVPEASAGFTAVAWSSIGSVVVVSWTAALAVLIIAAWGVANLVALTERRLQFAYAVTHELRTPLTTFRLYSDMLSAGLVPDDVKQEYLDTLNRESQRLSTLVEAVLEYARLENQKVKLNVAATDPTSLLRVLTETLEKRCERHGVAPQAESSVPEGHPLRTDVNLVNQITAVLVDNACRHARTSKTPTIQLQLSGDNGKIHLDVIDSGPGIELADSRRIFKPFRRGKDADASARGGVGLGLALARNWAALLGGRLDLVARHDAKLGGAHFRLTVPSFTDN
jgi:signal transduction histidine kinase